MDLPDPHIRQYNDNVDNIINNATIASELDVLYKILAYDRYGNLSNDCPHTTVHATLLRTIHPKMTGEYTPAGRAFSRKSSNKYSFSAWLMFNNSASAGNWGGNSSGTGDWWW